MSHLQPVGKTSVAVNPTSLRTQWKPARTCIMASVLFFALFFCLRATCIAQNNSEIRRGDDSDWWSAMRTIDSEKNIKTQDKEPVENNFQILGVRLRNDMFTLAATQFGKTSLISRGDASTGRNQSCYVSKNDGSEIHLVFEQTEFGVAFYLFKGGPAWDTSPLCTPSGFVTNALATASGLHLGQLESEVVKVLGPSPNRLKNELIYSYSVRKATAPEDLKILRKKYPQLSEKEFHANYDLFNLNARIVAKFANSRLIYLSASRDETD
jgi:hypothetical protein